MGDAAYEKAKTLLTAELLPEPKARAKAMLQIAKQLQVRAGEDGIYRVL